MRISEVSYSVGRTINTGSFESVRLDFSGTAVVGSSDDHRKAYATLREEVDLQLNEAVNEVMAALGAKGTESKPRKR